MLLTDKYKPKKSKDIIGQFYNIKNIKLWLLNWNISNKNKCIILTGPPGTGKTISAHIIPSELNYYIVEYNTSDIRNKQVLEKEITKNQENHSIKSLLLKKKKIIIMDEIDGITDKGGLNELNNISKKTKYPIIFICNEITLELRTISNNCQIFRFYKPKLENIFPWIKNILIKEKIKISNIDTLINESNFDLRQILIKIQFGFQLTDSVNINNQNIFETTKQILNNNNTIEDNLKLYFNDYFMIPLMIHENYLINQKLDIIEYISDNLSIYDITTTNRYDDWSLLPILGILSCHSANILRDNNISLKQVNFTKYLGNLSKLNSKKNYFTSDFRIDILGYYNIILNQPILTDTKNGLIKIINFMKKNKITKEQREIIIDLSLNKINISSSNKRALTRALNK